MTNVGEEVEKYKHPYIVGRDVNGTAAKENCLVVPQKGKIELPYDPATLFLGTGSKELRGAQRDSCVTISIAALFTIAKKVKMPKCPSKRTDEQHVIHTCNGILFSHETK